MSDIIRLSPNRHLFLSGAAGAALGGAALTSLSMPAHAKASLVGAQVTRACRRKLGGYEITVLSDSYADLPHQVCANISPEDTDRYLKDAFLPEGTIRNGVNAQLPPIGP